MSDDEIEKNDKFDNMIRAIKSREALPKYSVVLWEVLRIMCYVYNLYNKRVFSNENNSKIYLNI